MATGHRVSAASGRSGRRAGHRPSRRTAGSGASLSAFLHAVVFEAVLVHFGAAGSRAGFLLWLCAVVLQLVVVAHTAATWWTTRGRPATDEVTVGDWDGGIDVFVTVYGEPLGVVLPVVRAARDMDLAHRTWVLDDGGSARLREACDREGVGYLHRPTRENGKAGNVNHALARTRGELVAIFDADHRPDRGFLRRTVGHFADGRLAFVQTPQSYGPSSSGAGERPTVPDKNWSLAARGAREAQDAFYRHVMPGKAAQDTAICVGTNVVFRRAALDRIGGLHTGSQSEDVHTSLRLHALGLRSLYLPEVLARGLPPADWAAYLRQQRRWARGAFEILLDRRLWGRGGPALRQRLQYGLLGTHYLASIIVLLMALLPSAHLLAGVSPVAAPPGVLLGLVASAAVTAAAANRAQNGTYGLAAAVTHAVSSPACVLGLLEAVAGRRSRWAPTHGAAPGPSGAGDAAVRGGIVAVNLAAVVAGTAAVAARLGHTGAAAALGLPAARDVWVALPVAWCLAMALTLLLPPGRSGGSGGSSPHKRPARVLGLTPPALPLRWSGAVIACAGVVLAADVAERVSSPLPPAPRPTSAAVWRDDFTGRAGAPPDARHWVLATGHNYPGGPPDWGTGEIQEYVRSPRNARLDGDGHLVITATAGRDGTYRSARLETRRSDHRPPEGGTLRIQARVRLPSARGSWATFWALGRSYRADLRWPASGEIDVLEYRGTRPGEVYGVAHCPDCGEPHGRRAAHRAPQSLAGGFHTYTVDRHSDPDPSHQRADRIDWYVDGRRFHSVTRAELGERAWVFDQPVFVLLNLAVGGDWPGAPEPADYPSAMTVDYVEIRTCLRECPPHPPGGG
ncbi:glycosyltransferase [Actinomadura graeca]|uniref:Glycosyltransferase n=1 Tax=Actinomadura graeca TaxID=2750812 RepID=A0ABX8QR19_9ACTN|nr:glycosyltransferase family 2 protein [Actinomadura graeca]QXJ21239.1 glycosyltransferase [Actinomadura graeca]